ncbi:hypothetical protein HGRIS_003477 [Hohenbuehelia grisea]|uniref:Uncharacterized protein n=1 Tax=Hohenbuehelia grisea TaxID=104357 RepID=A0ABR3JGD7_9AGAR
MFSSVAGRVAGAASRPLAARSKTLLIASSARTRTYSAQPSDEVDPQLNGYPQLPFESRQYLPAKGWQDELMRRNYGDTLHEKDELLSMWGPDIPPIEPSTALFRFTLAALGFVTAGLVIKASVPEMPAVRREYPFSGLVTELGGLEENKARTEELTEAEE